MIADSSFPARTNEPSSQQQPGQPPPADLLSDHEYDGIQEYDNPMPRWWVLIFWGCFYFAVCYGLWFHVFAKGSVAEDYAADMRVFREEAAKRDMGTSVSEQALEKLMKNPTVMTDARALFTKRCVQCHGANGEGLIGPNLTDDYWLHGQATLMDIYGVVNSGVPAKGMPEWGKQLASIEVAKVAAYVGTLRGLHAKGRPPEGTLLVTAAAATGGK